MVDKVKGHGLLHVSEVTGWLSDALHDFITTKYASNIALLYFVYFHRGAGLDREHKWLVSSPVRRGNPRRITLPIGSYWWNTPLTLL